MAVRAARPRRRLVNAKGQEMRESIRTDYKVIKA